MVPAILAGGGAPEAQLLYRSVRDFPSLIAFPAAIAAALFAGAGRRRWLMAAAAAVLAVPALYLGSGAFRAAAVSDPLLIEGPTAKTGVQRPEPLLEIELSGTPTMLRADPDGSVFAVAEWLMATDSDGYDEPVRGPRWRVLSRSGNELLVVEAQDLAFVDGGSLITLTHVGRDFSAIRLDLQTLGEAEREAWSIELPFLYSLQLAVDAASDCWSLSGTEFGEHGRSDFIRRTGCVGSSDYETGRWTLATEAGSSVAWTAIDDRVALAQTMSFGNGSFGVLGWLRLLGGPETELLAVSPDGSYSLGGSRLNLSCAAVSGLKPTAVCAAHDGRDAFLWQLEARRMSVAKKPLAAVRTGAPVMISWATPEIAVLSMPGLDPLLFDRETGGVSRLDLPGEGYAIDPVPAGPGELATLIRHDDRTTLSAFLLPR
jgi:hypothetical protein